MASDGDLKVIVCARVDDPGFVSESSIVKRCKVCGAQVWLSRETASRADVANCVLWCLPCFEKAPHVIEMIPPSPAELESVIAAIRRHDRRQRGDAGDPR